MPANTGQSAADFLRDPTHYPEPTRRVEVVETHCSWVFLAGRRAYKLKKPVRFEFLDFSTAALRRAACEEELRVNRALAPSVYLDVVPLTIEASGEWAIDGAGAPADWVVRMRRLPARLSAAAVLRRRQLRPAEAQRVAELLARFYSRRPPLALTPGEYARALERHVRANGEALTAAAGCDAAAARRIQNAQQRFLHVAADLIASRALEGRIVEGHGDLRPEHIYLEDPPVVIDALEFSAELRQVDVADELSFLGMECRRLGDDRLARRVWQLYQQASADPLPPRLLDFYACYRAAVRAKVAVLRQGQQPAGTRGGQADPLPEYVRLAEIYAEGLGPPAAVVVCGLMGSGKSTLADALARAWGAARLSTDRIRRETLGPSAAPAAYAADRYAPAHRERVYDALLDCAEEQLRQRITVVLDGTFLARRLRERVRAAATRCGAACLVVRCQCPRDVARQRILQRPAGGDSEARSDLYDEQVREFEPPAADEPTLAVDGRQAPAALCREVSRALGTLLFATRRTTPAAQASPAAPLPPAAAPQPPRGD
jgi:aminoglycoside phosphotransferase family enzyme/predicted kinase